MKQTPTDQQRSARINQRRLAVAALLLVDALTITLSFAIAYVVRFFIASDLFGNRGSSPTEYILLSALFVPTFLVIYVVYGLYRLGNLFGGVIEYERLFNAVSLGVLLIISVNFVDPAIRVAPGWLFTLWATLILTGVTGRFLVRRVIYKLRKRGLLVNRALIVGATPEGIAVAQQLNDALSSGIKVIGFADDSMPAGTIAAPQMPVLGGSAQLVDLIADQMIDTVVIASTGLTRERMLNIYRSLDLLQNVDLHIASGVFELLTTGVSVREEGRVPLITVNKTRITGLHYFMKTGLDYTIALIALTVFAPLLLLLALLVRLDSPGPIIHRRRVVGVGKQEFDAFKFRTMHVNGNALLSAEQKEELDREGKLKVDPRITRIGTILRKFSLDEIPQLFNVLIGQMSLIGPRMITRAELEKFGNWQHNLLTVKPGLTGLWQTSGRSDLSYEERVRLDMLYIRNYSIWLDLIILFRTIPALLMQRGAY